MNLKVFIYIDVKIKNQQNKFEKLPLTLYVLIPNKETSPKQIYAFCYRDILCDINKINSKEF